MVSKCVLAISILVLLLSYNIYNESVPPGTSQPAKLKITLYMIRLGDNIIQLLSRVGVADYVYLKREMTELGTRYLNRAMDGVETEDTTIDGVPVRVYRPTGLSKTTLGPAMVYYHGGGWTIASINTHSAVTAYFAKEVNMLVISVGYRLNPEHSQRAGLDDCLTATKGLIKNGDKYGVDPERVVIAGDSAGGNYAAAVSLVLRDEQFSPMPKIQMLIYPAVQGIDLMLPSYQQNTNRPLLLAQELYWYMSQTHAKNDGYMPYFETNTHVPGDVRVAMANGVLRHDSGAIPKGNKYAPYTLPDYESGDSEIWDEIKERFLDPYHYPLMADDHSNLPMAYIFTSQYDMIRDDGYLYAATLKEAGVDVTHYNCPIGFHGMVNMVQDLTDSADIMDKMCEYLREKL